MKQLGLSVVGILAAALCIGSLGSCGGDSGSTPGTPDAGTSGGTGTYYHYVTNTLKIGKSSNEAAGFAFNLDGKAGNDNSLGGILAGLDSQLGIDAAIASALTAGDFVILHSMRADNLTNDPSVTWQVFLGAAQMNPKLDGTGTFTVAADSPTDAIINGSITGGKFSGGPASITLKLALLAGAPPLTIKTNATRLEATVDANGCASGRLGGAIVATQLITDIVPLLATALDARLGADAGCRQDVNQCEPSNKLIRDFFDIAPKDGMITAAEIQGNLLIQAIFTPDVDVLKADGTPGSDGVAESVSVALGFTCVRGTYTAPTEQ